MEALQCRCIANPHKAREQLGKRPRHDIECPRSGFDRERIDLRRQNHERYRHCDDASDRHLDHAIESGLDWAHVGDRGYQNHKYARKYRDGEAPVDRSKQRQRRDYDCEDACQRNLTWVGNKCGYGTGIDYAPRRAYQIVQGRLE